MRSKGLLVVLALVAAGAVGWLLLGTEGLQRLFGGGREAVDAEGGAGLGAGGGSDATDARGDTEARGPILRHSARIARIGKGALVGRVLDVRTAKGLAKAVVTLAGTGLGGETVAARAETGADGAFRIADVAAGLDHALRVESPGAASLEVRGVVVKADGTADVGDLWLGLPGALEGVVLDAAGQGLVGAEVQLHRGMGSLREFLQSGGFLDFFANLDREPEPLQRTTTQAKGTFRFEGANAGPIAVVARAPGYKQAIVSLTLTADVGHEPVKIRLAPGATLSGKVLDAAGKGMSGVHLAAFSQEGGMPSPLSRTFAETSADGAFRFASLAGEGRLMVVAAAPGYPNAFVQATAGDTDVRLVLRRGATLDVRLVTDGDEAPVAGALVLLAVGEKVKMDDGPASLVGGLTDASGATALDVFPGEIQMVIVNAPGHAPSMWDGAGRSEAMGTHGLKGPRDPTVPEGRSTVTFRLPRGFRVKGRVTDMEGNPLPGAEVSAFGFLGGGEKAVSGADGSYELAMTPEFGMGVLARLPGWVQAKTEGDTSDRDGARDRTETTLDIHMRRATVVTGRVLDPEGRPLAGARVTVRPERQQDRDDFDLSGLLGDAAESITLRDGTYAVEGVPTEAKVRVLARREGLVEGGSEAFEVGKDVTAAPDVRLLAGASLVVKVVDPGSQGVGGARVRVDVERADKLQREDLETLMERETGKHDLRTSAAGTVDVALLPPGKVKVRVTAPGFAPSGARLTIGAEGGPKEPVVVRLKPGVTLSGRVVDQDGHPLEGATVRVSKLHGVPVPRAPDDEGGAQPATQEEEDWVNDWDRSRRATTDAQGRWGVSDLPARDFQVQASKDGYSGKGRPAGEERSGIELRLVKQDPEAVKRIEEIDKELMALYGRIQTTDEAARQPLFEKIRALQEERQRLAGEND